MSVFALASAPLDSADARAFLQRRIALFAKIFGLLVFGFFLLAVVSGARERMAPNAGGWNDVLSWGQLAASAGFGLIWFRTRSGRRWSASCAGSTWAARCCPWS